MRTPVLALAALAFAATLAGVAGPALANPDLMVRESKLSVKETIDALVKAVEARGIRIAARVDHAAAAKAVNKELKPIEVVMFGNPNLGTPLMQANPAIGLELPMKVVAYTDASGKVMVAYTKPDVLKARYGIKDNDAGFKAMSDALAAFTTAATAGK